MWITHSYVGITRGKVKCLFFLLFENYIEVQKTFVKELDLELEQFARSLKDAGVVVRPFLGDIEHTRQSVLDKPWTETEKAEVRKTPALLMIEDDFEAFDPRRHRWILFHLADRDGHAPPSSNDVARFRAIFTKIAEATQATNLNPFDETQKALAQDRIRHAGEVVEFKPGIFGISVDLRAAGHMLTQWFRDKRNSSKEQPPNTLT